LDCPDLTQKARGTYRRTRVSLKTTAGKIVRPSGAHEQKALGLNVRSLWAKKLTENVSIRNLRGGRKRKQTGRVTDRHLSRRRRAKFKKEAGKSPQDQKGGRPKGARPARRMDTYIGRHPMKILCRRTRHPGGTPIYPWGNARSKTIQIHPSRLGREKSKGCG